MKTALLLVRTLPHYRHAAFAAGLERLGYSVITDHTRPADVLVTWNRSGVGAVIADRFDRAGVPVIVAENGYIGIDGDGHHLFALARGQHNGAGRWPHSRGGAPSDRWEALGIVPAVPRALCGFGDVLVLPQRGIGPIGVGMPRGWLDGCKRRLATATKRYIRIRMHPGTVRHAAPVEDEFATTAVAVTWGSGAGIKAIVAGVPVAHDFPEWIGAPAAELGAGNLERAALDEGARWRMLCRLAYAQWSAAEIETGEPFKRILDLCK